MLFYLDKYVHRPHAQTVIHYGKERSEWIPQITVNVGQCDEFTGMEIGSDISFAMHLTQIMVSFTRSQFV